MTPAFRTYRIFLARLLLSAIPGALLLGIGLYSSTGAASEAELKKIIALQQAEIKELKNRIGPFITFKPDVENLPALGRNYVNFWTANYKRLDDVIQVKGAIIFSSVPEGDQLVRFKFPANFSHKLKPGVYPAGTSRYARSYGSNVWDAFRMFFYIGADQTITFGWSDKPAEAVKVSELGLGDNRMHEFNIDATLPLL